METKRKYQKSNSYLKSIAWLESEMTEELVKELREKMGIKTQEDMVVKASEYVKLLQENN